MDIISMAIARTLAKEYTDSHLADIQAGGTGGISYYFCAASEYNTSKVPTVSNPDTSIIYITPSASNDGMFNLYNYKNRAWNLLKTVELDVSAAQLDTTLTVQGKAADAKAVGDELATVKDALSDLDSTVSAIAEVGGINIFNEFIANKWTVSGGNIVGRTAANMVRTKDPIPVEYGNKYVISLQNFGDFDHATFEVRFSNQDDYGSQGGILACKLTPDKKFYTFTPNYEASKRAYVTFYFHEDTSDTIYNETVTPEELTSMLPKFEVGEEPTEYTEPQTGISTAVDDVARDAIKDIETSIDEMQDTAFGTYGLNMLSTIANGHWTIANSRREGRTNAAYRIRNSVPIAVKPATKYTLSVSNYGRFGNLAFGLISCNADGNLIANGLSNTGVIPINGELSYTFITTVDCYSIGITFLFSESETFTEYTAGSVTVEEFLAMEPKLEEGIIATGYTEPQTGVATSNDLQARSDIDIISKMVEQSMSLNMRATAKKGWLTMAHRGNCFYKHTKLSTATNTLAAVYLAFLNGANFVEFDVRRTADDILVCSHDATITGYNTNGEQITYTVAETNAADICALYLSDDIVFGKQYIPTAKDMLKLIYKMGGCANIDVKTGTNEDILLSASLVRTCGMTGRVMYSLNNAPASVIPSIMEIDYDATFMGTLGYYQGNNIKTVFPDYSKRCYAYINLSGGGADRIASMEAIKSYGINLCVASVAGTAHEVMRDMCPEMIEYEFNYDYSVYEEEYIASIQP